VFSKFDTEGILLSLGSMFLLQLMQSTVEGMHACLSFQPELATYLSERNGLGKKTATHFVLRTLLFDLHTSYSFKGHITLKGPIPDCWLHAGLLARSQYSEGPATGHLDTGFSWFPRA